MVNYLGYIEYDNGLVLNIDKKILGVSLKDPGDVFTPSKVQYAVWIADVFRKKLISPYPPNGKVVEGGVDLDNAHTYDSPERLQGQIDAYFSQGTKEETKNIESNKQEVAYSTWDQLMGEDIDRELKILKRMIAYSDKQPSLQKEVNQVVDLFKKANEKRDYDLYKQGSIKLLFLDYYIQKGLDHPAKSSEH